ncbi:unnamed protein product [Bemisia tabaci]|uniref:Uncharacterized protein n=1 Tax=Bemisia tabaci TaxID=7038 RepID=A0A9P0APD0_BEMTA|nr:unnamed protein product [Bemisia tabaci]
MTSFKWRVVSGTKPADSLDTDWVNADSYDEGYFTVDEPPPSPPRFPRTPQRQDVFAMDSPARKYPDLYYRTPLREEPSDDERQKSPAREGPLPNERPVSPKRGESPQRWQQPSPVGSDSPPHDRPVSSKRGESPQRGRPKSPEKMTSSPRKPRPESPEGRRSPQREKPKSPPKWRSLTRPRSFGRKSKTEDYSKYTRGDHLAGTADAMQRFMADLPVPMPKGQQTARQEPATTQEG